MALYDDLFGQFGQPVAQILLTKNDLADVSFWYLKHKKKTHFSNSVHNTLMQPIVLKNF